MFPSRSVRDTGKVLVFLVLLPAVSHPAAAGVGVPASDADYRVGDEVVVFDVWDYFEKAAIEDTSERADVLYLLTSLQGIVNRDAPRLYLFAALSLFEVETTFAYDEEYRDKAVTELDRLWWKWFREKGYLDGVRVIELSTLQEVIAHFSDEIEGLALWEMKVPATVNVAQMAAGASDLLPVSVDLGGGRLRQHLARESPGLAVELDLTNRFTGTKPIEIDDDTAPSTGSAKNDAYRFAIEAYLKHHRLDPSFMWYNCDAAMWGELRRPYAENVYAFLGDRSELQHHGMYNGDYWVAKRAFFFDLQPWGDTAPIDDPDQPLGSDLATWHDILHESYKQRKGQFGLVGGFVPWWLKYTTTAGDEHEPVATEHQFIALCTSYNMLNEGDAAFGIANASFFMHLPQLSQRECAVAYPPEVPYESDATYLCFFMLDYDGSAWVNQMAASFYRDPKRGRLPLNWAINPILHRRIPHALRYLYENRTPNDIFGISDDGVGYLSPMHLHERKGRVTESGVDAYERFARTVHDRYGIKHTAFYISPEFVSPWIDMAARIDPKGFGCAIGPQCLVNGTPVSPLHTFHVHNVASLRQDLDLRFEQGSRAGQSRARFRAYRCIALTPTMVVDAVESARRKYPQARVHVVDAPNYFRLLTHHLRQPAPETYKNARELTATPRKTHGLDVTICADGMFTVRQEAGASCWAIPSSQTQTHLYFDVDNTFAQSLKGPVALKVTWLDRGEGAFGVHYDSTDASAPVRGAYKAAEPVAGRLSENHWQTTVWKLSDPRFANRQNGGADYRIYSHGDELCIREVTLRRLAETDAAP